MAVKVEILTDFSRDLEDGTEEFFKVGDPDVSLSVEEADLFEQKGLVKRSSKAAAVPTSSSSGE